MSNNKKREPKKTWYWIPFSGAIFIFIIEVLKIIYMNNNPNVGPPPITVSWSVMMVLVFVLQGINGLYQYKKHNGKSDKKGDYLFDRVSIMYILLGLTVYLIFIGLTYGIEEVFSLQTIVIVFLSIVFNYFVYEYNQIKNSGN